MDEILNLEMELSSLPKGTLVWKKTSKNSAEKQPYLQWREGGKIKSRYIPPHQLEQVKAQIQTRISLQGKIRDLKREFPQRGALTGRSAYQMNVISGEALTALIRTTVKPEKRNCFASLQKFLSSPPSPRICALYGLRRTGKTTLLHQLIEALPEEHFKKAVYIKARRGQNMSMLDHDLKLLFHRGYRYIFIDEITFLEDFIDTASLLSDIYAAMGMKIILSGTDSLSIWLSSQEELYDRVYLIHTTWIPYSEHSRLLSTEDIDSYIAFGGTLRSGETDFDDPELRSEDISFRDNESTRRYIDTSICKNIQHSLKCYENGSHFMHLQKLQDRGELTGAIERIIEDMNHRFVLQVLTRDFSSNDLSLSRKNLLKERDLNKRTDILSRIDVDAVTKELMELLSISNQEDQKEPITEACVREIEDYLRALDFIESCPVEYYDSQWEPGEKVLITQPGMRFCQAQALIHSLLKDPAFQDLEPSGKDYVQARILEDIQGRMLEEIVLLECKKFLGKDASIFKYQFLGGEYDMVIHNREENTCRIYEIKHSREAVVDQFRHLLNEEGCLSLQSRFGKITGKYVLYRGEEKMTDWGILYLNVSSFLKDLPQMRQKNT